jgi:hypothetical protein
MEKLRRLGAKTENSGLKCEDLYRWEDRHVILETSGAFLQNIHSRRGC